jgi:hypothetical protein
MAKSRERNSKPNGKKTKRPNRTKRQGTAVVVPAKYTKTDNPEWDGNPFIEALPPLKKLKSEFMTMLEHLPPVPSNKTRLKPEVARIMEMMSVIQTVVLSFPEHEDIGLAMAFLIRQAYVSRNPLTAMDRQRRHAIATGGLDGIPLPKNWKTSAGGHIVLSATGMGKTTFFLMYLLTYPQVIRHTEFEGTPLKCLQMVYIALRVPHDATLKSLCLQFFQQVDRLLGTNYLRQAKGLRTIALMVSLMNQVATTISLGFLVVDDLQKLRHATGENAEYALNLLGDIVEQIGVSLLTVATPGVEPVVAASVANSRKIASTCPSVIEPMRDEQFKDFCEALWPYMYVLNKGTLDRTVLKAWYKASAGNTAFAVMAFVLAQRQEIGGREIVDAAAFELVAKTKMAFLQPAIAALLKGEINDLRAFEDLIVSPKFSALCKLLGAKTSSGKPITSEEFDDLPKVKSVPEKKNKKQSRKAKKAAAAAGDDEIHLPYEDPLEKS